MAKRFQVRARSSSRADAAWIKRLRRECDVKEEVTIAVGQLWVRVDVEDLEVSFVDRSEGIEDIRDQLINKQVFGYWTEDGEETLADAGFEVHDRKTGKVVR